MMNKMIDENEATGKVKDVLLDIKKTFGMVPNLFKAQAAVDADWLELNWSREKTVMLSDGGLDRKTRELIALTVSLVNRCEYCTLAHETMAHSTGATDKELGQVVQIVDLFSSFNVIAEALHVPCDIKPDSK
jgi:uncharacterized peroxidase-related enzyme